MELVGVESFFRKSAKATIKQKKNSQFWTAHDAVDI